MTQRWLGILSLGALAAAASAQSTDHPKDRPLVAAADVGYNPTPLMAVAVIYAVVLWPLVRVVSRFERRLPA